MSVWVRDIKISRYECRVSNVAARVAMRYREQNITQDKKYMSHKAVGDRKMRYSEVAGERRSQKESSLEILGCRPVIWVLGLMANRFRLL